ncbi:unnamed protein product [Cuscuta epithymum]|uniref:Uncharacterized protein n=1 Tax=Cuscuta epithymum TaxID=186058 RepID=A0AAV0EQE5_9ASTE|nr:unnamed protein product [Cuscuta epithymum]
MGWFRIHRASSLSLNSSRYRSALHHNTVYWYLRLLVSSHKGFLHQICITIGNIGRSIVKGTEMGQNFINEKCGTNNCDAEGKLTSKVSKHRGNGYVTICVKLVSAASLCFRNNVIVEAGVVEDLVNLIKDKLFMNLCQDANALG